MRRSPAKVKLPAGYWIEWGGAFENQQRAMARLGVIVPLTIGLIFILLYTAFNSVRHATLIIANVPFAIIGGIVGLFVTGQYLSVPSAIGFIAVFGVAMLNGIVLVTFLNDQRKQGLSIRDAVRQGAALRLRPVLMTASVAILGLVPMLISTGVGAETQRPLATVVVGGLITSTLLTLLLLPLIYEWSETRAEAKQRHAWPPMRPKSPSPRNCERTRHEGDQGLCPPQPRRRRDRGAEGLPGMGRRACRRTAQPGGLCGQGLAAAARRRREALLVGPR